MNTESVTSLFLLFSAENDSKPYEPIISLAVKLTEKMLCPDADITDVRLEFLAAALANFHVQHIKAAHDRTAVTYTGKMLSNGDSYAIKYAKKLLSEYMELCCDIIRPKSFVFFGISDGKENL